MNAQEFGTQNAAKIILIPGNMMCCKQFEQVIPFPNAEDHPFEGLGHGEIIAHPDLMAREIEAFMRK